MFLWINQLLHALCSIFLAWYVNLNHTRKKPCLQISIISVDSVGLGEYSYIYIHTCIFGKRERFLSWFHCYVIMELGEVMVDVADCLQLVSPTTQMHKWFTCVFCHLKPVQFLAGNFVLSKLRTWMSVLVAAQTVREKLLRRQREVNLCYHSCYHRMATLRASSTVQRLQWKPLSLNHALCVCTNRFFLSSLALNPISMSI